MSYLLALLLITAAEPLTLRDYLVLPAVGGGGRSAVYTDALQAAWLAGAAAPEVGDTVATPRGERTWAAMQADEGGTIAGRELAGGYACVTVTLERDQVMLLEAPGASYAVVSGAFRGGDPYSNGSLRLPVRLAAGPNVLLFRIARGQLAVRLLPLEAALAFDPRDATLPDRRVGEAGDLLAGITIVNAGPGARDDLWVEATGADRPVLSKLPRIPAMSVRKVPVRLGGPAPLSAGREEHALRLRAAGQTLAECTVALEIREPGQSHKVTFRSAIDGSVQYYAVLPRAGRGGPPALFLSLHGAGVEAIGQANAYAAKSWGDLVAPTNRRPFGFDWEDWGRRDALEVLDHAMARLGTDPRRVYLTGHSMGGHGAWQVAANAPDRFAATGPSAGWISFQSYGGGPRRETDDPLLKLLQRAGGPSDTLSLIDNLRGLGLYVLHGDADDNVPVTEARDMLAALGQAGLPAEHHEQPGAGHWWDAGDEPGAACVDWPPMFDLFAGRRIPSASEVRRVCVVTANPQVCSRRAWLEIEAQQAMYAPARAELLLEPWTRRFAGTTQNVARLRLDASVLPAGEPLTVALDDGTIEVPYPPEGLLWLRRGAEGWAASDRPAAGLKGPARYGPFKLAFDHEMVYVYGTGGTEAERAWSAAKARYDAETWHYRGNGAVDVVADVEFDPAAEPDRGVILIGDSTTNAAWPALLGDSPVMVRPGAVTIGDRLLTGDDLAAWFCRPRPGSATAMVAVIAATGAGGRQVAWANPYFISGAAYPDCLVASARMLTDGADGLVAAGAFGEDWGLAGGEFAVR